MENCGLFNRMPDSKVSPLGWRAHFCFIHLTLQEFLAARKLQRWSPVTSVTLSPQMLQIQNGIWLFSFVAGLLCGKENQAVNSFVSLLHDSLTEEPPLKGETKQKALLMMKCLHEYNNETTVEKAACELQKNKQGVSHLCDALKDANCKLTELDLNRNKITEQGVSHLCDALKDLNCKLTELDLRGNSITDLGVSYLCDALKDVNCKLTEFEP
ncbi:hypothetical protein OS493_013610 [Desmophyllum pertusum]|uniref:Uncharacterized protein n=1 Tax=Desmophyllum pertusum TaxID=174260 RepID=A0A9X0DB35_9CNID|nr:hypothetical protein OS493_013610 [Desmophyllum pertusum]